MKIGFRQFVFDADWAWVNAQVGILRVEDTNGLMAIDQDTGLPVGACIMDNWTPNSVQCHFMLTSPMVLKHGFLETCFDVIFNQTGRKVIYGLVPSDKEQAIKFNEHLRFTEKSRFEDGFADGIDYILYELKKADCKQLPIQEAA